MYSLPSCMGQAKCVLGYPMLTQTMDEDSHDDREDGIASGSDPTAWKDIQPGISWHFRHHTMQQQQICHRITSLHYPPLFHTPLFAHFCTLLLHSSCTRMRLLHLLMHAQRCATTHLHSQEILISSPCLYCLIT